MSSTLSWSVVVLALVSLLSVGGFSADPELLKIGIVTDVHAHDTDSPIEGLVMTNYAERLAAFVNAMNTWQVDAIIELGDLVNGAFVIGSAPGDATRIAGLLQEAVAILSDLENPIHYVLGNHDLYDLSKAEFSTTTGLDAGYYSFDLNGYHFVVLDAEYDPDGADYDHVFLRVKGFIPEPEIDWLSSDLAATTLPTIVCVHQPVDSEFDALAGGPPIANNRDVQRVLRESGVVIAVLQGHDHESRHAVIDGIHYLTFDALVDHTEPTPPTYALMTLDPEARTIRIEGFGLQESWELSY